MHLNKWRFNSRLSQAVCGLGLPIYYIYYTNGNSKHPGPRFCPEKTATSLIPFGRLFSATHPTQRAVKRLQFGCPQLSRALWEQRRALKLSFQPDRWKFIEILQECFVAWKENRWVSNSSARGCVFVGKGEEKWVSSFLLSLGCFNKKSKKHHDSIIPGTSMASVLIGLHLRL